MLDVEKYRKRLLEIEQQLQRRIDRDVDRGRGEVIDGPHDPGDESVADVAAGDEFTDAELNSAILRQVQAALRRIDQGTYGRCLDNGHPMSSKRLDAIPWAAYCAKHQALLEAADQARTWTL